MLLSCDNMARNILGKDQSWKTGHRNEDNTEREKENTWVEHIPRCDNTWQHVSECGTLDKVHKGTQEKMCHVHQHKVEKKQVTLGGKSPGTHFIFAKI